MEFARSGFAQFIASPAGRALRVGAGVLLIVIGLLMQGIWGWIVAIIGLV